MLNLAPSLTETGTKPITKFFFFLTTFLVGSSLWAATITCTINAGSAGTTIPPGTYGSDTILAGVTNPLYRQGGNRMTAYNWENNASNSGQDYCGVVGGVTVCNHEDNYMFPPGVTYANDQPATTLISFILGNNAVTAASLVTLQMAGYVSANPTCNCFVTITGAADTSNTYWDAVSFSGGPTTGAPATSGSPVYMNSEMAYLLSTVGGADSGGAQFYDLDNEPALWNDTHPLVHPNQATCTEVAGKGVSLSTVITSIDPNAQILGPVCYGWSEYVNNQSAPDDDPTLNAYTGNPNQVAYLDYYLATMNSASNAAGRRLLHYMDLHWYPAATTALSDPNYITTDDTSYGMSVARMQAPRSLWDPAYTEISWITADSIHGPVTLIPRLQSAVSQYYPGTGLSFSEYQYGSGEDISGGVAHADALGIFGQNGALACWWPDTLNSGTDTYVEAAFNLYLNYDGQGSKFGNLSIPASSSSVSLMSVYAARSTVSPYMIWVVAINRDYPSPGNAVTDTGIFNISNLAGEQTIASIRAFRFDANLSSPTSIAAPAFTANTFTDSAIPGRSGTLYEITLYQFTPTPTFSPTPCTDGAGHTCTFTPTPTVTNTPTVTPTPEILNTLFPNPVKSGTSVNFSYNVTGPANQVEVKLFTLAFRKIYEDDTLSTVQGQHAYTLNWGNQNPNIANGLYYVVLDFKNGGSETHQLMKLLIQK